MNLTSDAILYYADNPVDFVEDIIRAKPDSNQKAILNSVAQYPMTSVRSGHGIGKSAVESWLAIWFLTTRPYPKIPCTAPTQHQLWDILWAEIAKWLRSNPALSQELIWTKEKVYMRGHPEEWFAVGRTASKPDALQGFHAEHVLYIIDEASGVRDEIFEPVLGALSTEGAKLVMCGNPTKITGFFYDSHHKSRELYNAMHIDGRDSSRVDQQFIDTIIDMFGEDSDVFRVRVAGEFPKALPDSFIPMEWAERASEAEAPEIDRAARVDIGIDVARYGDDSSVLSPVLDKKLQEKPEIYHHNDTMELSGKAVQLIKRYALSSPGQRYTSKSTVTAWASASLTASWSCGSRSWRKFRPSETAGMPTMRTPHPRSPWTSWSVTSAARAAPSATMTPSTTRTAPALCGARSGRPCGRRASNYIPMISR